MTAVRKHVRDRDGNVPHFAAVVVQAWHQQPRHARVEHRLTDAETELLHQLLPQRKTRNLYAVVQRRDAALVLVDGVRQDHLRHVRRSDLRARAVRQYRRERLVTRFLRCVAGA